MLKRILLATVVVFVTWVVLDFIIHGVLLAGAYASTPALWRPQAEMNIWLIWITVAIGAFCFSAIYGWLIGPKSLSAAVRYGLLFGFGSGVAMGYGTYAVQPIPYTMALTWFVGTLVEAVIAGVIVGLVIREPAAAG